jgi:hypothetical protein
MVIMFRQPVDWPSRDCHDVVTSSRDDSGQSPTHVDAKRQVTSFRGLPEAPMDTPNRLPKLNTRVRFPSSAPLSVLVTYLKLSGA